MSVDWPFKDTKTTMAISVRSIFDDGRPILFVSHDMEFGMWQFQDCRTSPQTEEAMMVCLGEIVANDPTVRDLADLPQGWAAWREHPDDPWQRAPQVRSAV